MFSGIISDKSFIFSFISDYPTSHFDSIATTPSSTLSSKHLCLSKNRIQDYIRQLNKSLAEDKNDSTMSPGENQMGISKKLQNGVDAKTPGLLLQVIDNFVSCTIDKISRQIKQIKISNDGENGNEGCGGNGNKDSLIKDNSDANGMVEVMKNVRQFISGVKNYLIKTGEGDLHTIMQEERSKVTF